MATALSEPDGERPRMSRKQRFFAGYGWLVLRNILGWSLILTSLVAGPLIPGPGGIPLFLVGFALASFPGKRRLTAAAFRGRQVRLTAARLAILGGISAIVTVAAVLFFADRLEWFERLGGEGAIGRAVRALLLGTAVFAVAVGCVLIANVCLRLMPRIRRRIRPWLRKHRIRLLPPRWRTRRHGESGVGPVPLREEVLGFLRRRVHSKGRG